jgi:hypothetical protein
MIPSTNSLALDPKFKLWCYVEGKCDIFSVDVSSDSTIDDLKNEIYIKVSKSFAGCDPMDLTLTKVCYFMISM